MFLSNDAAETKAERCDRMLGELSEHGLALARDLAARALAAETPAEATDLALAFHRISRSLRQTLALEAKVERDRLAAAREAAKEAAGEAACEAERQARAQAAGARELIERRKQQVRGVLNRLIWDEAESDEDEFEALSDELRGRLDGAGLREGFADIPFETLILQLKADMGLQGELTPADSTAPAWPIGSDAWGAGRPPDPG